MCISNLGTRRPYQASSIKAFQNQTKGQGQQLDLLALKELGWGRPEEAPEAASSDCSTSSSEPKRAQHHHITVVHNYHDHANDNRADYQEEHPARGGVTTPFPLKLHEMLLSTAREGMEDIVSWQPHGRCFLVHKPKEFVELLPRYFKLSKLASFQRQLNLYGFQRLTQGRDRGGYYHELFLRDRIFLSHSIQRIKVKGTGVRARSNPDQEPDFWAMPWVLPAEQQQQQQLPVVQQQQPMMSMSQSMMMPSNTSSLFNKLEDDVLVAFGDKTFHYLDPFQDQQQQQQQMAPVAPPPQPKPAQWDQVTEMLNNEADSFFEDFDFPDNFGVELENDAVFGSLLESLIS
mmetsp:Transcript_48670/g.139944  ORF Transcript_48670/g.139944 Transcript_48670/m.139944 type:complete len:346 (-) Transcript_48670:218-1255(-)